MDNGKRGRVCHISHWTPWLPLHVIFLRIHIDQLRFSFPSLVTEGPRKDLYLMLTGPICEIKDYTPPIS